jgi:hypothetical protein
MSRDRNRLELLLAHRPATGIAIEVAPYFNPALPKAKGNDVLILDVFDTPTLRTKALDDPSIAKRIAEIEQVDIVGDASRIGDLVCERGLAGQIGYVVSSHNFEHLPDPISFLRGVEAILMPGGVLSMAIPDYRATFDHFRSPTRLVDWLVAYHDSHRQPTNDSVFDLAANAVRFSHQEDVPGTCDWRTADPSDARFGADLRKAYSDWLSFREQPSGYRDTHVSVLYDAQFRLLIEDLRFIGLIGLEVIEVSENHGHEFFAHLCRPLNPVPPRTTEIYVPQRDDMMRKAMEGIGASAFPSRRRVMNAKKALKSIAKGMVGAARYQTIREWNRDRLARKRGNN